MKFDSRGFGRQEKQERDAQPWGEVGRALGPVAPDTLHRLHADLEWRAARAGLVDIGYATTSTPVGELLVAVSPNGLVRIAFQSEGHEAVVQALADSVSPRVLESRAMVGPVLRQLDEYFGGHRKGFEIELDLGAIRGFRRAVLDHLRHIEYGSTQSYAQVATSVGSPTAVRAVGTACGANPIPVVVPCHRVLRSDGTIGGYLGGLEAKQILLALEGAHR